MTFIYTLIGVAIGFCVIRYSFWIVSMFGSIGWAEQHIGGGGTYTLYKIIGVIIIALSLLNLFGGLGIFVSPLTPLFGGK